MAGSRAAQTVVRTVAVTAARSAWSWAVTMGGSLAVSTVGRKADRKGASSAVTTVCQMVGPTDETLADAMVGS